MKPTSTLSRIRYGRIGRSRSSRKHDKIRRGYKRIYSSLVFAALREAVPKRKIDQKWFGPVSCGKRSDCVRGPQIKTDRVESRPSLVMRKLVDNTDPPGETLGGSNPNVTIGTMGAHYLIRIFTYKNFTPLSVYLSKLEVESMEVVNVATFTGGNNVFYDIVIQASVKSQSEIHLLRDHLCRLASAEIGQNSKAD